MKVLMGLSVFVLCVVCILATQPVQATGIGRGVRCGGISRSRSSVNVRNVVVARNSFGPRLSSPIEFNRVRQVARVRTVQNFNGFGGFNSIGGFNGFDVFDSGFGGYGSIGGRSLGGSCCGSPLVQSRIIQEVIDVPTEVRTVVNVPTVVEREVFDTPIIQRRSSSCGGRSVIQQRSPSCDFFGK